MDTFRAHQRRHSSTPPRSRAFSRCLREHGLVTFTSVTDRTALAGVARRLMSIRPHRDAGPDGVTVITDTGTTDPGYAGVHRRRADPAHRRDQPADPPGLLLLTCQQPASQGGTTLLTDAARITATLAGQHPPPSRRYPRHEPPTSAPRAVTSARSANPPVPGGHASAPPRRAWPCSPPGPAVFADRAEVNRPRWPK